MATVNREVSRYASFEYEHLAEELLAAFNIEGRGTYPLGSFIQALKSNYWDEKEIISRLKRYTDLSLYYSILYTVQYENLPMYINDSTLGVSIVAKWRMNVGK